VKGLYILWPGILLLLHYILLPCILLLLDYSAFNCMYFVKADSTTTFFYTSIHKVELLPQHWNNHSQIPWIIPWTNTQLGYTSFTITGPWLWNTLPAVHWICHIFRRLVRTHLFIGDPGAYDFCFNCTIKIFFIYNNYYHHYHKGGLVV